MIKEFKVNNEKELLKSCIFSQRATAACIFPGKTTAEERRLFRAGQSVERCTASRKDGTSTLTGNEKDQKRIQSFQAPTFSFSRGETKQQSQKERQEEIQQLDKPKRGKGEMFCLASDFLGTHFQNSIFSGFLAGYTENHFHSLYIRQVYGSLRCIIQRQHSTRLTSRESLAQNKSFFVFPNDL